METETMNGFPEQRQPEPDAQPANEPAVTTQPEPQPQQPQQPDTQDGESNNPAPSPA
jgi:hypothetical protein